MGECRYYMKVKWAVPITLTTAKRIRDFLVDVAKAEWWWQEHREKLAPAEFWPRFRKAHPEAARYLQLQGIDTKAGDCNNDLCGKLEVGYTSSVKEDVKEINGGLELLEYSAEVYDAADWTDLCEWFMREYGACSAAWVSENNVDPFEMLEV